MLGQIIQGRNIKACAHTIGCKGMGVGKLGFVRNAHKLLLSLPQ